MAADKVSASTVFTTHTPVPAGSDEFPLSLIDKYFSTLWPELNLTREQFIDLARHKVSWGDAFSMPVLALRNEHMDELMRVLRERARDFGGACFAERFIDGREFNLSLLAGPHGPEVLPPVEILFEGYPPKTLRIVGYRAKWDESSYEFHHTPRRFDFAPEDSPLLNGLQGLAAQCWRAFGLNGYARVDFRVDAGGQPWVLEINANPCLSPDAGFAAALQAAGLSYTAAIDRILADVRRE